MNAKVAISAMLLLSACASAPAPSGAVADQLWVAVFDGSPYWKQQFNREIRNEINKRAGYQLVSNQQYRQYTMSVRMLGYERYATGATDAFHSKVKTRVEAEAFINGKNGGELWRWSGYGDARSDGAAVEEIAEQIAKSLDQAGLLKPGGLP